MLIEFEAVFDGGVTSAAWRGGCRVTLSNINEILNILNLMRDGNATVFIDRGVLC